MYNLLGVDCSLEWHFCARALNMLQSIVRLPHFLESGRRVVGDQFSRETFYLRGEFMIRVTTLFVLLAIAVSVSGQPLVSNIDGQTLSGTQLSVQGTGFGENPLSASVPEDSQVVYDSPAKIILSNSATFPDSASSHQEIQPPLTWTPTQIDFKLDPGNFQPGESVYLYVVDALGESNSQGYLLIIEEAPGEPGQPAAPGQPGTPIINR